VTRLLEVLFWLALIAGVYPYFIYPLLAAAIGALRRREVKRAPMEPRVSVIIAAHNEVAHIERTVLNKLEQDYPSELLEVIVISDESVDGTDDILRRLAMEHSRVRWRRQEPRAGKSAALNVAVEESTGDIIVFSDANSLYDVMAVRRMVRNFADLQVGYVTGKMVYRSADGSMIGDGCSAYMRFENWLRVQETRIGSIVGVDGGIDAIRRSLFRKLQPDQLPDFVTPLSVVARRYRVVYEPEAVLEEESLGDFESEFRMRVRVSLRALWALRDCAHLLSFRRDPLFAWQLWSHKLLRYLAFLPLLVALLLAVPLAAIEPVYLALLAPAVLVLLLAAFGFVLRSGIVANPLVRFAHYFVLLNAASALAVARFVRGERITVWKPRIG
jgi:cellulose synthase/poly-beta-1,6-N-acetylglucosamine synthase-like glycosyltransferase